MSKRPAVVVLGAGLSQRFGEVDKLAQDLDGKPLALHALEALAPFEWEQRVLVCRAEAAWTEVYRTAGFELVLNSDPAGGMLWSLHLGVTQAKGCEAVLIMLADMPLVTAEHLTRLVSCWRESPGSAVATSGEGYLGPPAIIPRASLLGLPLRGEGGARSVLGEAIRVESAALVRRDIDTVAELVEARLRLSN